jgi:Trk K+ transport system NAD-binding subunit
VREGLRAVIVALVMVCYLVAEHQAHQSGILAAMVMGFTISAAELPDLVSVKAFKGQLTTLLISVLFILLSSQLDLGSVLDLGWSGVLVVAGLIALVRPAAVALSIWPRQLDWRGRTMIGLTAPRGIVAAAVASLGAREMSKAGIAGGGAMEGLVYLAILATGAWSTLAALVLPRLLGFTTDPTRRRAVLVGANALSDVLARHLVAAGRTTLVVDAVSWRLDRFRNAGILAVVGDARDASVYEEAGVERDSMLVAATTNDELNLLVAELVHAEFGVEHPVVAIQSPPDELGRRSRAWVDLLGGGAIDVPRWIRRIENEQVSELTIAPSSPEAAAALHAAEREKRTGVLRLIGYQGDEPILQVGDDHLDQLDRLTLLISEGRPQELLAPHRLAVEDDSTVVEEVAANTPKRRASESADSHPRDS